VNDTTIPVHVASNYRCREHVDQPVTWRGRGCTHCAVDLAARKTTKQLRYDDEQGSYR
jgi:hypothetical protein